MQTFVSGMRGESGMSWDVWNSIAETPERFLPAGQEVGEEPILEICGVDRNDHLFIEKTAAMPHHDGMRKFRLTAAVEQDGIVLIRPMHSVRSSDFRGGSSLFQICKVEEKESIRVIYAQPFEPLPNWPRYKHSYVLK